ncbi:MAG: GntR family transcriptional regulator [Anaerolineae bacterium]|nr:GntR family transcriptional regulator [Anaerolineae bacterium]
MQHYVDRIVRDSKLPYYYQLYVILRHKIRRGEWQPGDMIPPESELVERYGVSRVTARQALEALANEGLIERHRGKGTFVAYPTIEQALTRIISFTEDMRQRGAVPSTRVLSASLVPAPEDIAAKLEIAPGDELVRLERLRLADGEPMTVEESYLVHRFCPGLLELDYRSGSLRELLEVRYDLRWVRAKQVIRAINAPRALAAILSVKPNAAVLFIERISFNQQDIPGEYLRLYHRGDRYSLYNELRG